VAGAECRWDRIADSRKWIRAVGLWVALRARMEETRPWRDRGAVGVVCTHCWRLRMWAMMRRESWV
jgi:hypothetical protein